jgi:hypothetical protein
MAKPKKKQGAKKKSAAAPRIGAKAAAALRAKKAGPMADRRTKRRRTRAAEENAVIEEQRDSVRSGPRATDAQYYGGKDVLLLKLAGDVSLEIPRARIPGLEGSSGPALWNVDVVGSGEHLRWAELGVAHAVPALLARVLGIPAAHKNGSNGVKNGHRTPSRARSR